MMSRSADMPALSASLRSMLRFSIAKLTTETHCKYSDKYPIIKVISNF